MEGMEKFLGEFGIVKQFVNFEAMVVIYLVIEAIKEIVNRLKPLIPVVDIPDSVYPAFSIVVGGILAVAVEELNITIVVGLGSGAVLTVLYKKFESWINKLGIKK